MGTYYLKKEKDIISSGHLFDSTCFDIDSECSVIDLGQNSKDYYTINRIGSGVLVRGGQNYKQRKISLQIKYIGIDKDSRNKFLSDWLTNDDTKYLYRDASTGLQRIKVFLNLNSGETWKNYTLSEEIKIELLTELPFFEEIASTTITQTLSTVPTTITITNDGLPTPMILTYILSNVSDNISFKTYENVGVDITYSFLAYNTIVVDTSNLSIYINGQQRFPDGVLLDYTGSPFRIETGTNNLTITCDSVGDLTIEYYKRYL